MPGLTVEQLYEAYMDTGDYDPGGGQIGTPFAEDVYKFFGGERTEYSAGEWAKDWGRYLPEYDPTEVELSARVRDLDKKKAHDVLNLTKQATDRVYNTELDTLSTQLGAEMRKAETVTGGLGLRSGTLESALSDTMSTASSKAKDLGERLAIQNKENQNKYEASVIDATLDFDKAEHQSKKDFYQRTLAAIDKMGQVGAFKRDLTLQAEEVGPALEEVGEMVTNAADCIFWGSLCSAEATVCLIPGGQSYNECKNDCMHRNTNGCGY